MKAFRDFIFLGLEVLRSHFVYWLILYFVIVFYTSYVDSIRVVLLQGKGVSIPVLVFFEAFAQFGMLVFYLIWLISIAVVVLAPLGSQLTPNKIFARTTQSLSQLIREQLRVYAGVMWRLPFFLIFGVYKWLRWIMVPLIVVFDETYLKGEVDALKRSELLTKNHGISLLALLLVTFLIPDIFELIFIDQIAQRQWTALRIAFEALGLFFQLYASLFFVLQFKKMKLVNVNDTVNDTVNDQ